ncbi:MAG: 4-hydroxythreonine-4-phosphate dehydrogenase PdxA [Nitrospirae bacterium]|nr:4-hydroxythreonine-4-phosphate dehydrogenase PdxA [Nitrospirota bacterium]
MLRKIAITIGDPAGIGPEVVLKAIMSNDIAGLCQPVIIGDRAVIEEAVERFDFPVSPEYIEIVNVGEITDREFIKGRPTDTGGRAAAAYIKKAVDLALNNSVDAIVTAPISKESLRMAGFQWPGHTEMLAELTGSKDFAMVFYSDNLRLILVTRHTALRNVPSMITKDKVLKTIVLARKACDLMDIEGPRIAVAGLNPHSGEAGIFGSEEIDEIEPAVKEARQLGMPVSGPYPADALFHRAYKGEFDIIVCMYHDQGLIPFKMIAFDKGVNITVGLPIIRTSPDHGTAYDIAWKGIASPSSIIEAIKLSVKMRR